MSLLGSWDLSNPTGNFSRSFSLPTAIKADAAKAEFKDGLLTLTLPKTEEVKPTHIKVQVS